ncbi:MAG: transposase [Anaerolineaceae bacterium]|nr:transposase [Anaerolineaceae bacterium]
MSTTRKRYSEAVIRQVISEYETGSSIAELQRKYGITGNETIQKWIKKYSKEGLRHKYIRIQQVEEINQVKALEKRIKELEQALGKTTLEKLKLECIVEEYQETYGAELVKKKEVRSSTDSSQKPKA